MICNNLTPQIPNMVSISAPSSSSTNTTSPLITCFYPHCTSKLNKSFGKHISRHLLGAGPLTHTLSQDLIKYCSDYRKWFCNICRDVQSQGHTCLCTTNKRWFTGSPLLAHFSLQPLHILSLQRERYPLQELLHPSLQIAAWIM
jgi:hypothetical protein